MIKPIKALRMNRVILIGNGFDLAHGLPTRYEDFINWYWDRWGKKLRTSSEKIEQDEFCSFVLKDYVGLTGWRQVWSNYYQGILNQANNIELVRFVISDKDLCHFSFKSIFFSQIYESIESKGWVDIEQVYYDLLCEFVKDPDGSEDTLAELNNHFHLLQSLLIDYLTYLKYTFPQSIINTSVSEIIYSPINKDDICISQLDAFWNYVKSILQNEEEYRNLLDQYSLAPKDSDETVNYLNIFKKHYNGPAEYKEYSLNNIFYPRHILLLNFNYTTIGDNYKKGVSSVNHIHGTQYSPTSVIFGYGDELDEKYKALLTHTDNECLRHIKSIKYLESGNYRDLLQFIESDSYQIYIMGHSCGNSDRTLLNTLFEHKNCVSIKPYYYQKVDGSDNYMEIV